MKKYRHLLLNASVSYALAFFLMATCHEFAHGAAALVLGQHPTVFGVREQDASGVPGDIAFIAAAGPVMSLLLGLLFLQIEKMSALKNIWRELLLWFGLMNVVTFFGYLLTAPFPFFASGDVAAVIQALGWPDWTRLISFAVGGCGIVAVGYVALQRLLPIVDPDAPLRPQLLNAALFPWILGSAVILLASLPWSYATWPVAVVTSGLFTMLIGFFARGKTPERSAQSGWLFDGMSTRGTVVVAVLLVAMIAVEQTVLRDGVRL